MKEIQLTEDLADVVPVITERCFRPNIDSSYTKMEYDGERIAISTKHKFGIKPFYGSVANCQGMAIYDDILVRMANGSTHYIFRIATNGALSLITTFSMSTTGHANALQFAPKVESGNTYPYLYVSDLTGSCEVLNIASDFTVTQVQKITVPTGWQVQIGDDGFIWAIAGGGNALRFIKYRSVAVSEGDVILTTDDILDDFTATEKFDPNAYTFQGSKFKFGKVWLPIGTTGSTQKRALFVYDLSAKRAVAKIDLTNLGNIEFEDLDFWDDAVIICTYYAATHYILRF